MKIVNIAINVRSPMGLQIRYLTNLNTDISNSARFFMKVKTGILQSQSSKRGAYMYLHINPKLEVSPILQITAVTGITEQCCISSTRLRLQLAFITHKGRDKLMVLHTIRTPPSCASAIQEYKQKNYNVYVAEVPHITDVTSTIEHSMWLSARIIQQWRYELICDIWLWTYTGHNPN